MRKLILVVILFAVAFTLFYKTIRLKQREAFLQSHKSTAAIGYNSPENSKPEIIDLFLVRWTTDDELEEARRLFPEANVVRLK